MAGKKKGASKVDVNEALLENFVSLQKVLTNLTLRFEELSGNMGRLLELFEISAKSFADKGASPASVDQEFLKKLDSLLDQNKTISKGIMMMEDRIRGRGGVPRQEVQGFRRPIPR
ncbi:hypothetical protein CMI38_01635 [Candidatus Pacearchaeota archaeon]|jgi:hypothetical protein|nr:hypothetical protein [Candidatus Pacearchaeota archaeon]|tara:strand:+ start:59 stop:406 length:348 start_codon:yes stop_codon:yes gene_type:complete